MYAVIETGGKQYRVSKDDVIYVEKLDLQAEDKVVFDKVLYISSDDGTCKTGSPYLEGATVEGKLIKNGKAKKITVFTYRPKHNSKRKLGHRQQFSKVHISEILS